MKSAVLAIAFGLVMFAAFCGAIEYRSGGGCYHSACWKWCGNDLDPWEDNSTGTSHFSITIDFFFQTQNECQFLLIVYYVSILDWEFWCYTGKDAYIGCSKDSECQSSIDGTENCYSRCSYW